MGEAWGRSAFLAGGGPMIDCGTPWVEPVFATSEVRRQQHITW
jgi:hypothetical protein